MKCCHHPDNIDSTWTLNQAKKLEVLSTFLIWQRHTHTPSIQALTDHLLSVAVTSLTAVRYKNPCHIRTTDSTCQKASPSGQLGTTPNCSKSDYSESKNTVPKRSKSLTLNAFPKMDLRVVNRKLGAE
jgi:hypothetical protein